MKTAKTLVSIFVAFILWVVYQLWLPTLSLAYLDGFLFIAVCAIIGAALFAWWISDENEYKGGILVAIVVIAIIALVIGLIAGCAPINASTMYKQIGDIEDLSFTEDIVEIDNSQIPTVDIKLAEKLADKKMGEEIGLGSQMKVGKFTNKQSVNGKLVYVAPLEHRGLFKWLANQDGTSGYVVVSATNTNDVKLVMKDEEGNNFKLKYLRSAFFSSDLHRYIRSQGYRSTGLTEYTFELDDTGRPYYVVTTYKNKIWWGCPEATGVVICDAQTGECKWYSVKNTPEWVDIIQPESFIKNQLENYGRYVHNWWNPSNKDELSVTEHMVTVYNEGDCYYYTGMSSVGNDNGTVGFIMVNTRDKKAIMYKMVGATEESAMKSAQGEVQDMGYESTEAIPLNVGGVPTYFITLKDDEGLVKNFSFVNINDYGIVGAGATIAEAKRNYSNKLTSKGNNVAFSDEAFGYTKEGIVTRITANIESGNSYYYMIIDDDMTKLFMASYMISEELPVTREGDKIKISYVDEANGTINVVEFDNLNLSQKISAEQQQKNEEATNIIQDDNNKIVEVDPEKNAEAWESLSEEERSKLLEMQEKEK